MQADMKHLHIDFSYRELGEGFGLLTPTATDR